MDSLGLSGKRSTRFGKLSGALDVRDDGVGFDPASLTVSADGGFGLTAMRERVERLAGTLEVESERGTGTAISACVPALSVDRATA
jgi:signal transduction histidine kinase